MTSTLIDNIGELLTCDGPPDDPLGVRTDCAVVIEDTQIAWIGPRATAPEADVRVDALGAAILPGFVDSHAHLVFAGDRAAEFSARMAGVGARPPTRKEILSPGTSIPARTKPESDPSHSRDEGVVALDTATPAMAANKSVPSP